MDKFITFEVFPNSENSVIVMNFYTKKRYTPLHWHENFEILYVFDGNLDVRCNNSFFTAHEGDCIVINKNELHEIPPTKSHFVCIMLPPSLFKYFEKKDSFVIKNYVTIQYTLIRR